MRAAVGPRAGPHSSARTRRGSSRRASVSSAHAARGRSSTTGRATAGTTPERGTRPGREPGATSRGSFWSSQARRPIGCILERWKFRVPAAWRVELGDSPPPVFATESVDIPTPELALGAVDVLVPGVEVRDRSRVVLAGERDLDVRDVMAGRLEPLPETDGDRRRDCVATDDRRVLGPVVDRRVFGEERRDVFRLVAVEVEAVPVDQAPDLVPVGLHRSPER